MQDPKEHEIGESPVDKLYGLFPKLDREERRELVQRIDIGADGGVDFMVMMCLAAALASLGLLQGSGVVVIGAMLVAPLMGPLIGAGLSLVQGNKALFSKALRVTATGVGLGLVLSLVFGLINPGYEPSLEIEARGTPDVLDLFIALASGMVAAYAIARPNVSGTLAGVAIAAALLPPLAVIGIGLTNERPFIAMNAGILFVTNLVAIILGAALVFRVLGIGIARADEERPSWARNATRILLLIGVILLAPLVAQVIEKQRTGAIRPLSYPVAPHVREAVDEFIDPLEGVELVSMGRISTEPEGGITAVVAATRALPKGFRDTLIDIIRDQRGDEVIVRLFAFAQAPEAVPDDSDKPATDTEEAETDTG
jgi:uncharacterized hydrophobic protein (TIGR00271 family)